MLKLQSGKTWENSEGYSHGDFVAYISKWRIDPIEGRMTMRVSIYKDQAAKDAGKGVDETKSYDVEGAQYDTAINAIKNRAKNNDEDMVEAVYSLLLGFPFWENWEKV